MSALKKDLSNARPAASGRSWRNASTHVTQGCDQQPSEFDGRVSDRAIGGGHRRQRFRQKHVDSRMSPACRADETQNAEFETRNTDRARIAESGLRGRSIPDWPDA